MKTFRRNFMLTNAFSGYFRKSHLEKALILYKKNSIIT